MRVERRRASEVARELRRVRVHPLRARDEPEEPALPPEPRPESRGRATRALRDQVRFFDFLVFMEGDRRHTLKVVSSESDQLAIMGHRRS